MISRLRIDSSRESELIDITDQIRKVVRESGVNEGICVVNVLHTTAGLIINENADPSVRSDIIKSVKDFIKPLQSFTHTEGNSPSHIRSSIVGTTLSLIVEEADIILGTWQGIFFCEFDGPRRGREVVVKVVPDG